MVNSDRTFAAAHLTDAGLGCCFAARHLGSTRLPA